MKISASLKADLKRYLVKKQKEESDKVVVTSAYKISKSDLTKLQSLIPDVSLKDAEVVVDESLFAGYVIQKGSKVLDLSLKGRLYQLEQKAHEIT